MHKKRLTLLSAAGTFVLAALYLSLGSMVAAQDLQGGQTPPPVSGGDQSMPPPNGPGPVQGQGNPPPQPPMGGNGGGDPRMMPPPFRGEAGPRFEGGPAGGETMRPPFRDMPGERRGEFGQDMRSGDNFSHRPFEGRPEDMMRGGPGDGREGGPRPLKEMPSLGEERGKDFGKILNKAFTGDEGGPQKGFWRGGESEGARSGQMMRGAEGGEGKFGPRGDMQRPNEMGPRGDGGQWMGGGDGEGFDEEMDQDRRLEETRRHLGPMMQGLKMIKKQIARMEKKKVPVPAEVAATVSELEKAAMLVKDAKELDDATEAALELIMEKGEDLRDIGPMLGVMEQWPRMEKQIEKRISQLKKGYAKQKAAVAKSKLDVSDGIADMEATIANIEASYATAKSNFQAGNFEEVMNELEGDVFATLDDAQDALRVLEQSLQAAKNGKRALTEAKRTITGFESQAKKLKASGADTSTLLQLIAEMNAKYQEMSTLVGSGKITPEAMYNAFTDGEQLANDAEDEIARLKGAKTSAEKAIELAAPTNGATLIYSNILDFFGF